METQSTTTTIRKLLAKAESSEHEAEASVFRNKALELMTRYSIDEAMLADVDVEEVVVSETVELGTYAANKRSLVITIARAFGCHVRRPLYKNKKLYEVVGFKSDVDMVVMLVNSLIIQLDTQLLGVTNSWSTKAARTSFAYAWCDTVGSRVEDHYRAATAEAEADSQVEGGTVEKGVALVLADRSERVEQGFEEKYGYKPKYVSCTTQVSNLSASSAGRAAGHKANIGQSGLGSGGRALTS